ncbi:molybdate ABC transporter substrate-binding protein [Aestuariirhabdus sp. Z084]|uniref:molybdate ABC transporter substrate-binding protein n=1 Tax=Aestuariirhabdus haliotis TaxID=2918751 RepID=UPI00201B396F|nr:molybdate ABC transporter substrate-binding protein [Aestuariirhabdus haliotis]MCL6414159.1 molybdate ABC transporter substrate-binding protein [Aestuariirhabdus haliotis]MCL6418091.1 molybdate ABC transporter substrate-binding protein [Aestuariirhabdus haliotis]
MRSKPSKVKILNGRRPSVAVRVVSSVLLASLLMLSTALRAETTLVAAASSLKFALDDLIEQYHAQGGSSVQVVFGSSGNFYRQIRQGAPYQILLSADESYVRELEAAEFTQGNSFVYNLGRLAYFAPKGSPLDPKQGVENLRQAVERQTIGRFSIANPAHAPYGRAALEVLQQLGIEKTIQPNLVLGENASQAAQFAVSGSTDGGLIAYSLAISPQVASRGDYALVPSSLHTALKQRAVLTRNAGRDAQQFFAYLQTAEARTLLRQYGFSQ